jgi:hypothetical protein
LKSHLWIEFFGTRHSDRLDLGGSKIVDRFESTSQVGERGSAGAVVYMRKKPSAGAVAQQRAG